MSVGMRSAAMDEQERQVREAIQPLLEGVPTDPAELADRAAYSRFHFHRVFKRIMGETPGDMRRRLSLERAAWMLAKESVSATETAFEVGFGSLEGFSRAFKKAFGVLPSSYSESGLPVWLPAPSAVHYSPLVLMPTPGGTTMDLIDRLIDNEIDTLKKVLQKLKDLPDDKLDAPLPIKVQAMCYEPEQASVRDLLDQIFFTQEVWLAAVEKQGFPDNRDTSLEGLTRRAEIILPMFAGLVRRVRDAGEWDTKFTDELCEEPVAFSFGGMIAHVLTHGIFRRQLIVTALRSEGVNDIGYGDPLQWEQSLAGA
jgi:AraC family transcriptional regulator